MFYETNISGEKGIYKTDIQLIKSSCKQEQKNMLKNLK